MSLKCNPGINKEHGSKCIYITWHENGDDRVHETVAYLKHHK